MEIVSAAAAAAVPTSSAVAAEPKSWTPADIKSVASSLGGSMVPAVLSYWNGKAEAESGQKLSPVQVATMAPFLADRYDLPVTSVQKALQDVQLYVGGAIKGTGMGAITLHDKIYVKSDETLARILSWNGRRFLAHELGHVLQRERVDTETANMVGGGELGKTRASLLTYVSGVIAEPGARAGALIKGIGKWITQQAGEGADKKSVNKLVHDAHRLEIEAEEIAQAFRDATAKLRS